MLSASLAGVAGLEAVGTDPLQGVETMPAAESAGAVVEGEDIFDGMQPITDAPAATEPEAAPAPAALTPAQEETEPETGATPPADVAVPPGPEKTSSLLQQMTASLLTGQGPPASGEDDSEASNEDFAPMGFGSFDFSPFSEDEPVTWTGGTGDWNVGANWSTGVVPGSEDAVVIDAAGATITVNEDVTIASLTIVAGTVNVATTRMLTITGGLTVNAGATLTLNGSGNVSAGQTILDGALNLSVNAGSRTLDLGPLTGAGTLALVSGAAAVTLPGAVNMTGTIANTVNNDSHLIFESDVTVGTLVVGNSTTLGFVSPTRMAFQAGLVVTNELRMGAGRIEAAELVLPAGSLLNLTLNGTKTINVATVTIGGDFNWTTGLLRAANGSLWTFGPTATTTVTATVTLQPLTAIGEGIDPFSWVNQGSMTLSGFTMTFQGVDLSNAGTLVLTHNPGSFATLRIDRPYTQSGGRTEVIGNATFGDWTNRQVFNLNGGELRGTGELQANVINGGTIRPGLSDGTRGELMLIGDSFTQLATGRVIIEAIGFGAGQFNAFRANLGSAEPTFGGTFEFAPLPGFATHQGTSAHVLKFFNNPALDFPSLVGLTPEGYTFELQAITEGAVRGYNLRANAAPAHDTRAWDGGGDGVSFHDPLNWEDDLLPNILETAVIAPLAPVTVIADQNIAVNGLVLGGAATLALGSRTLTSTSEIVVGNGGTLRVEGGTVSGALRTEAGGTVVSRGGTFNHLTANLGRFEVQAGTTVWNWAAGVMNGGLTQAGELVLGDSTGTVRLETNRSVLNTGTIQAGGAALITWHSNAFVRNEGLWDQSGASLTLSNTSNLSMTYANYGRMELRDGALLHVTRFNPGNPGLSPQQNFTNYGELWVDATSELRVGPAAGSQFLTSTESRTQIDGTLTVPMAVVMLDGWLGGRGTITGDLRNLHSTVAPGADLLSGGTRATAGTLTVMGDYSHVPPFGGTPAGEWSRLEVEIFVNAGVASIDRLVAANATVDGRLVVTGLDGLDETIGPFLETTAGSVQGVFSIIEPNGFTLGSWVTVNDGLNSAWSLTVAAPGAGTHVWLGGAGFWSEGVHWSTGTAPGAGAQVAIGGGTVILDVADVALSRLELAGGALIGAGALTVVDALLWQGGRLGGAVSLTTGEGATTVWSAVDSLTLGDTAIFTLGGDLRLDDGATLRVDAGAPRLVVAAEGSLHLRHTVVETVGGASLEMENHGYIWVESDLDWPGVTLINRGAVEVNGSPDIHLRRLEQHAGAWNLQWPYSFALTVTDGLLVAGGLFVAPSIEGDVTVTGGTYQVASQNGYIDGRFRLEAGGTLQLLMINVEGYTLAHLDASEVELLGGGLEIGLGEEGMAWDDFLGNDYDILYSGDGNPTGNFGSVVALNYNGGVAAGILLAVERESEGSSTWMVLQVEGIPQVITWVGGTGAWNNPANWDLGVVPRRIDHVIITGGQIEVPEEYYSITIGSLEMTGGTLRSVADWPPRISLLGASMDSVVSNATLDRIDLIVEEGAVLSLTGDVSFLNSGAFAVNSGGVLIMENANVVFDDGDVYPTIYGQLVFRGESGVTVTGNVSMSAYYGWGATDTRVQVETAVNFVQGSFSADYQTALRIAAGASLTLGGNFSLYGGRLEILTDESSGTFRAGRLNVLGTASLEGTVQVWSDGVLTAAGSQSRMLIEAGSLSMGLSTITFEGFPDGYTPTHSFTGTTLTLEVAPAAPGAFDELIGDFNDGIALLLGRLADWFGAFNLASGTFTLLPDELHDLFGLDAVADEVDLPILGGLPQTVGELETALINLGYTVEDVAEDMLRVRIDLSYDDLTVAAGFTGEVFNLVGLDGLATVDADSLPATLPWTANLSLSLVFGVDAAGFYLDGESSLSLGIWLEETALALVAQAGGLAEVALTGSAALNGSVTLHTHNYAARYRATDLDGDPASLLREGADLRGELALALALPYLDLTYSLDWRAETEGGIATEHDAALAGELRLPGLRTGDGAEDAVLALTGTRTAEGWALTGSATNLRLDGYGVSSLYITVELSPTGYAGSGGGTILVMGDVSVAVEFTLTFDDAGYEIAGFFASDSFTVGGGTPFLWVESPDYSFSASATGGSFNSATLSVVALQAVLLPVMTPWPPTGPLQANDVAGTLSASGRLQLSAATVTGYFGEGLQLFAEGDAGTATPALVIDIDPVATDPDSVFATLAGLSLTTPTLLIGALAVMQLQVRRNGFTLTASGALPGDARLHLGDPVLVEVAGLTLEVEVTYTAAAGLTGEVTLAASEAALFPDLATPAIDGVATLTGLTGRIDLETGAFDLAAGTFTLIAGDHLQLTAATAGEVEAARLVWDPEETNPEAVILTVNHLSVALPGLLEPGTPLPTIELLEVRRNGFTATAAFSLPGETLSLGDPVLIVIADPDFTLEVEATRNNADEIELSASLAITAGSATFAGPASVSFTLGDDDTGDATPGVASLLDLSTGAFTLTARQVLFTLGGIVTGEINGHDEDQGGESVYVPAVTLGYDPTAPPSSTLLSIAAVEAELTALAFNGLAPQVTLTGLSVTQGGDWSLASASVTLPAGYAGVYRLGVLPFQLDGVALTFTTPGDFSLYELEVTGRFDLTGLSLGFTPVVYIGDPALIGTGDPGLITVRPGDVVAFSFLLDAPGLLAGQFMPLNFGPITLGIEGLNIAGITFDGQISFGAFVGGVLVPLSGGFDVSGFLIITGGDDVPLAAQIDLGGNFSFPSADVTRLELDVRFDFEGGALDLELAFTYTGGLGAAPFFDLAFAASLDRLTLQDIVFEFPGLFRISIGEISLTLDPGPGDPVATSTDVLLEFLAFPGFGPISLGFIELYRSGAEIDGFILRNLLLVFSAELETGEGITLVRLVDPRLVIDELSYLDGDLEGAIGFDAIAAILLPDADPDVFTARGEGADPLDRGVTGGLDLATGALSLAADRFAATFGGAVAITGEDFAFHYDPVVTDITAPVLTVGSATAVATDFPELGAGVLTGLVITRGSAGFESLTFDAGAANLRDVLAFDALSLAFTGVTYTYASATLAGTATLSAATAALFPGGTAFSATAHALAGTFDLQAGLDSLVITADELEVMVHDRLRLFAEDVSFAFASHTVATLATVEATLPDFPGLGAATISELVITRDGFTAGSAAFGPADLDRGPLQFSALTATLAAIAYDRVAGFTAGELVLAAESVALFPGSSAVTAAMTGVTATIRFTEPAAPLELSAASFTLTAGRALHVTGGPLSFTLGAGSDFTLTVTAAVASSPLLPAVTATLDTLTVTQDGFTLAGLILEAGSATVAGLLSVTDLRLTLANLVFQPGVPLLGMVGFTASSAIVLPALGAMAPRLTDDDAADGIPGISGELDLATGALTIEARRLEITLGDLIVLEAVASATEPALRLVDDPAAAPDSALFTIAAAVATIPALAVNDLAPAVTFTDFGLRRDGRYFQSGAVIDLPPGYRTAAGLGGILPFEITQLAVDFPDPDNLDSFTFSVTGTFDLASLGLPFDPILYIGDPTLIGSGSSDLVTILPGDAASLTLELDVISLRDGRIAPVAFGPVTLGVENLDLGGTVVSGVIELGRFEDGELQPLPGAAANVTGRFTIVSSTDGSLEIDATIELAGTIETLAAGLTRLALTGVVAGSGEAGSASGGVEITFELTFTFTAQEAAPFLTAEVEGRFLSIAFTDVTIDLGFIIIYAGRVEMVFSPAPGDPQYLLSEIVIEFPAYETLSGTSADLIAMFADRFVIEGLAIELTGSLFPDNSFVELTDLAATIDAEIGYVRNGNTFSDFELLSGGVSFTVGELSLFSGSTTFTARATNLAGTLDTATGELTLAAESFTAEVVDVISLALLNVELYLGNAPNRPVLQVATATATISALDDLAFTVTNLTLSRGGEFTLDSAVLAAPGGVLASFGLGGLLPFDITGVELDFTENRLDRVEVTVTGTFDFSVFEDLPFTPVLRIGEIESTVGAPSTFEFTLALGHLALGEIAPVTIGPIEIGFADLEVGGVTLGGTIIFGGYQNGVFVPSIGGSLSLGGGFQNVQGGGGITLLGTYDGAARRLSINASFSVSFTINDVIDLTDAALDFNLAFSFGASGFTLDTLALAGANIGRVEVRFGDLFVFTAVNVAIDFNPGPDGFFATFGALTVAFPDLGGLSGSAGNFGIRADFSFAALPGFFVSLNPPSAALFGFPDWLPVTFETITLQFADITNDPLDVAITLTVEIDAATFPLPISGRVEGLTIDIGLLRAGKFPITNLDAFVIEFGPIGFGGLDLSGMLALGLAALDAGGNLLEGLDAQNDDLVAQRILFGLIEGSVAVPGIGGLTIRLGLSEFGPLVIFISAEFPILLEPTSGLTLFGVRGGVRFGAQFPSVTDPATGLPDPELLRGPAFSPSGDMTAAEWLDALRQQVATIAQSGATPGQVSFADALSSPMLIELGASLGSTYLPGLTAEVDIIISTEGALLMAGSLEYYLAGVMAAPFVLGEAKFFIDLREIETGSVDIVFLLDVPGDPAILSISGFLSFDIVFDGQGDAIGFSLVVGGKAEIAAINLRLTGLLRLTVTTDRTEIFVDASLEYPVLGPLNAQGLLVFDYSGGGVQAWGALSVSFAQSANLGPIGVEFDAGLTVQFNVSNSEQTIQFNFENTGEVIDVVIPANSFALFVNGFLYVKNGNETLFAFEGVFIIEIAADEGLTIFVEASLIIGAAGPNAPPPLLSFSALGFLKLSTAGLAGKIAVSLNTNFPAAMGLELSGSFLLVVNTTGQTVTYTPPPIPGSPQTPSAVTIPGRLTPASAAGAYALIEAEGYLRVLGLTLEGSFGFALSADVLRVTASASLDIRVGNARLLTLSVAGGFQIDSSGLVASLSLSLAAGSSSGDYAFGGSLSFLLQINTTGKQVTQIGSLPVNLEAGRYARVMVTGTLTILGLEMTGQFGIEVGTNGFAIAAAATLNLRVQNVTLFSFNVLGALQFNGRGLAAKFAIALGSQDSSGMGGSFSGSFALEINTTGQAVRAIAGVTVNLAAGRYARVTASATLAIGGFNLAGAFAFEAAPSHIAVSASLAFDLTVGGTRVASFQGQAAFEIGTRGIVGLVSLSLQTGVNTSTFGFRLAGIFQLEINTTTAARTFVGGRPVLDVWTGEVVAGQTESLTIAAGTVRLYLAGGLTTVVNGADVLTIRGSFEFSVQNASVLTIRANAWVKVGPLAMLWGLGVFELRSTGIAAVLNLSVLAGNQTSTGPGFSLTASFQLELNTRATSAVLANARVRLNPTTGLPVPGALENVTLAARSFAVVATGSLSFTASGGSFVLQGRFELSLAANQSLLVAATAVANLQLGGRSIFALSVNGGLVITNQGIAASIAVNLQAGSTTNSNYGFNFGTGASFLLQINTTSQAVARIGGVVVNLPAGPYVRLAVSGQLQVSGLTLAGSFDLQLSTTEIAVTASFTLDLRAGNTRVFTFTGSGALRINNQGIAGLINLQVGAGPDSSLGFTAVSAQITVQLRINTTNAAVTRILNQNVGLEAGRYAEVRITGVIAILGSELTGTFNLRVGTGGFQMAASATLEMGVGNLRVIRISISGALLINSQGIAGRFNASLAAGPASSLRFSFGGNLNILLEINTTRQTVTHIAGAAVNLVVHGGERFLRVTVSGSLTFAGSFTLTGAFVLEILGTFRVAVTATMNVGPFSNLSVNGSLTIRDVGLYGHLELNAGARFTRNAAGFTFDARLRLEINTTSSAQNISQMTVDEATGNITSTNTTRSIAAFTVRVVIYGSLRINGHSNLFALHGRVELTFGASQLTATFDAGLNVFNARFNVNGSAGIYYGANPGLALRLQLSVGSNNNTDPSLSAGMFSFRGTFTLELNTRSVASNGVAASTARIAVSNFRLSVLGFTLSGSVSIGVSGGIFSITVPASNPLTLNLWNFVVVKFSGSFRSNGYLSLTASVYVQIGPNALNVSGTLSVSFTYNNGNISFSARLSANAQVGPFNITLASLSVNSQGVVRFGTPLGDVVINFRTGGISFDGPVAGALIVFDANRNGRLDVGEPVAYTNDLGEFFFEDDLLVYDRNGNGMIDEDEGDLLSFGGTDVLTGLLVTGVLRGSAHGLGSGIGVTLSPLTTLAVTLREFGYDLAGAEALILRGLFGEADASRYLSFSVGNPYDGTLAGTPRSPEVFQHNVLLVGTISPIAALVAAAGLNLDVEAATAAAYRAVAQALLARPGKLDLTDAAVIADIITRTAAEAAVNVGGTLTTATAAALANVNASLMALAPVANGEFAHDVLRHQLALQDGLATAAAAGNQAALAEAATAPGLQRLLAGSTPPETAYPHPGFDGEVGADGRTRFVLDSASPVVPAADGSYRFVVFNQDATTNARNQLVVERVVVEATLYDEPVTLQLRSSADGYNRVIAEIEITDLSSLYTVNLPIPLAVPVGGLGFSLTPVGAVDASLFEINRISVEGFVLAFFSGLYADYLSGKAPTFAQFFSSLPVIRGPLTMTTAQTALLADEGRADVTTALDAARILNVRAESVAERLQAAYSQLIHDL